MLLTSYGEALLYLSRGIKPPPQRLSGALLSVSGECSAPPAPLLLTELYPLSALCCRLGFSARRARFHECAAQLLVPLGHELTVHFQQHSVTLAVPLSLTPV